MSAFPKGSSFVKGHGINVDQGVMQRMEERHKRIIDANLKHIAGKAILDLASNNGRWSYAALEAGASFVLGIEGRQMLIDRGLSDFVGIDPKRYHFACGDIYDQREIAKSIGRDRFDTVLCLGIFYHITDHYRLFRLMRGFNPTAIIIDSSFIKADEALVRFRREDSNDPSMAIPENGQQTTSLSGVASLGFLRLMAQVSGYDVTMVPWKRNEVTYPEVVDDYLEDGKNARRFTFLLTARSDKPQW